MTLVGLFPCMGVLVSRYVQSIWEHFFTLMTFVSSVGRGLLGDFVFPLIALIAGELVLGFCFLCVIYNMCSCKFTVYEHLGEVYTAVSTL